MLMAAICTHFLPLEECLDNTLALGAARGYSCCGTEDSPTGVFHGEVKTEEGEKQDEAKEIEKFPFLERKKPQQDSIDEVLSWRCKWLLLCLMHVLPYLRAASPMCHNALGINYLPILSHCPPKVVEEDENVGFNSPSAATPLAAAMGHGQPEMAVVAERDAAGGVLTGAGIAPGMPLSRKLRLEERCGHGVESSPHRFITPSDIEEGLRASLKYLLENDKEKEEGNAEESEEEGSSVEEMKKDIMELFERWLKAGMMRKIAHIFAWLSPPTSSGGERAVKARQARLGPLPKELTALEAKYSAASSEEESPSEDVEEEEKTPLGERRCCGG